MEFFDAKPIHNIFQDYKKYVFYDILDIAVRMVNIYIFNTPEARLLN